MKIRTVASSILLVALALPLRAYAQTPVRFSAAAALALPVGDLGDAADVGFNLALRGEGRLASPGWSLRGDLSWDRFGGRGIVDTYSYLGAAGNLLHRSAGSRLYEFGGLGLYRSYTGFRDQLSHDDTNLGFQVGLGLDLMTVAPNTFVEFGLTNVITSGANSLWFPVRFGVRF